MTLQCRLADVDRRTERNEGGGRRQFGLSRATGVDYFENLCLSGESVFLYFTYLNGQTKIGKFTSKVKHDLNSCFAVANVIFSAQVIIEIVFSL